MRLISCDTQKSRGLATVSIWEMALSSAPRTSSVRSFLTGPSVLIAGMDLSAKVIKEGSFDDVDLTLLSVDQEKLPISLRIAGCRYVKSRRGSANLSSSQFRKARQDHTSCRRQLLPPKLRAKFGTVIGDVASTGNSGSGVFDANRKCLLGIISRKIQMPVRIGPRSEYKDLAKYFVPASELRAFIPIESRF